MTRAISSYPESERAAVIARRLKEEQGGLGYLSARDYQRARDAREAARKKLVLPIEDETTKTP